jgi:hypothetical protein
MLLLLLLAATVALQVLERDRWDTKLQEEAL